MAILETDSRPVQPTERLTRFRFGFLRRVVSLCIVGIVVGLESRSVAFPPAPHHLLLGLLRDEYGTPLRGSGTVVMVETPSGARIEGALVSGPEPGINFRIEVPMDSGTGAGLYRATALNPSIPFRIRVRMGGRTLLPIEMQRSAVVAGEPGGRTRLDLTLGEDVDGDGMPDAWERLVDPDISKVTPGGDNDGDGLTNLQEYIAGTYAFDPADGFRVDLKRVDSTTAILEFLSVRGRSYSVEASADLNSWRALDFRYDAEPATATAHSSHAAVDTRRVRLRVAVGSPAEVGEFYRLIVR